MRSNSTFVPFNKFSLSIHNTFYNDCILSRCFHDYHHSDSSCYFANTGGGLKKGILIHNQISDKYCSVTGAASNLATPYNRSLLLSSTKPNFVTVNTNRIRIKEHTDSLIVNRYYHKAKKYIIPLKCSYKYRTLKRRAE